MTKKKAFLAAPFDSYMNLATGRMYDDKIEFIDTLIHYLESKGYVVENSHKREKYGEEWMEPELCTPLDLQKIKESNVVVAIPGNPASGGVHIEAGWASLLDTRIIMLLEHGKRDSNLVLGLAIVGNVDYVRYKTIDDCLVKLDDLL